MRKLVLAIILSFSLPAYAEQWTDVTLSTPQGFGISPFDGQPVSPLNPLVLVKGCDASGNVCATSGIGIQNFASTNYVNNQFTGVNTQLANATGGIATINGQIVGINTHLISLDSQVAGINTQLGPVAASFAGLNAQIAQINAQVQTANQLAVVAAAMKDAIPNPGDRYAVRVNMAAWNSTAAGSVSFSANIDDSARLSVNYGRSQRQNIFSGGFNFSFN